MTQTEQQLLAACKRAHNFIKELKVPQNNTEALDQIMRAASVLTQLEAAISKTDDAGR